MSIRSLFWPGFILGMILMTGVSCLGAATVLGISGSTIADIRDNSDPLWTPPPPTVTPSAELAQSQRVSPDTSQYTFQIGDSAQNITTGLVRIRQSPGTRDKDESDIITRAQPGDVFAIVAGPEEVDGMLWWKVRYGTAEGATIEGWMAEATTNGITIMGR